MIEKFRRIQHSWAIKAILILTALSFMSLFGVSGYVNSAGANKTVIKVAGSKIGLNEIYALYNRDISMAQSMTGQGLNLSDEQKNEIMESLINQEARNLVVKITAQENGIDVSDEVIKSVIQSQNMFMGEDGKFSYPLFQRFLAMTYQSEASYINKLANDIEKQILINNIVADVVYPKTYEKYLSQAAGIKKSFEYIEIVADDLRIDRNISDDELDQYYADFASEFMAPETRDVSYVFIDTKDDYEANVELLDEIEDTIGGGASLLEVAKIYGSKVETAKKVEETGKMKSGSKAFSEVFDEISDSVFSYNEGEISNVVETDMRGFVVVEVNKIYPTYQKDISEVKSQIIKLWQADEKLAIAQEIANDVSNDVSAGDKLSDVAKRFSLKLKSTNAIFKDDSFASLQSGQMQDIFDGKKGEVKSFDTPDSKVFAAIKSVVKSNTPNKKALESMKNALALEAVSNLVESYGKALGGIYINYRQF